MQISRSGSAVGFRLAAALVLFGLGTGCGPPSDLVYSENPAVYVLGTAITPNRPSSDGGKVLTYSVTPALPAGLSLDASAGVISGTPTAITATANYLVTASNSMGRTTVGLSITVDPPGTFVPTGSMGVARQSHTATLLPNGKVLIAGGGGASAELYDPSTGTFVSTGSMDKARYSHTATLLTNGKVLIAGGSISYPDTTETAELYDPATGTFSATGSMSQARYSHTATLLTNGKVLITGGWWRRYIGTALASAELYDPSTGTFATTGSMDTARWDHTATLLTNGKVLIAGGRSEALYSNELYDPTIGTFSPTGSTNVMRFDHTATLLPNGRVLIAGGHYINLAIAELYDTATETFITTGSMSAVRLDHTATPLPNGKVLIAGGKRMRKLDPNISTLASAELYDAATGTFAPTGSMGKPRAWHTATLLPNGKVLIAGGWDSYSGGVGGTGLASAELYDLSH